MEQSLGEDVKIIDCVVKGFGRLTITHVWGFLCVWVPQSLKDTIVQDVFVLYALAL